MGKEAFAINKYAKFNVQMNMEKKINSNLGRVKVMVCHTGENLNQSKFSRESLEKALHTLEGIPLVGEYKESEGDFGGHGGKIEISDEGFKFIETTKPYGFIPMGELANIRFETITDRDGINEKEWLIADAYVWYKRYPEVDRLFDGKNNQSMEIIVKDYAYGDDGIVDITDFSFNAVCILGEEVAPAMSGAKIQSYADFKAEFKLMMQEALNELNEVKLEESDSTEEVIEEVIEEEVVEEEVIEEVTETESNEESIESTETEEVQESNEFETLDLAYDVLKDAYEALGTDFSILDMAYSTLKEAYEIELAELKAKNEELSKVVSEYQENERKETLEDIYSQFEELTEDEINSVKEKDSTMSFEEIEDALLVLVGRKQKVFSAKSKKKETPKLRIKEESIDVSDPYGGLFTKYNK